MNSILSVHWSQLDGDERVALVTAAVVVCAGRVGVCGLDIINYKNHYRARKGRGLAIGVLWRMGADWASLERIFKAAPRFLKVSERSAVKSVADKSFDAMVEDSAKLFLMTKPEGDKL